MSERKNHNPDPAGHAPHQLHRQPTHIQFAHEIGFPDLPGLPVFPSTQIISGSWACSVVTHMFYEHMPLLMDAFRSESVMSSEELRCVKSCILSFYVILRYRTVPIIFASILTRVDNAFPWFIRSAYADFRFIECLCLM